MIPIANSLGKIHLLNDPHISNLKYLFLVHLQCLDEEFLVEKFLWQILI